jgi:FKBP-type peptidyl-prolyl cis-trans isomerase FkpA
MREKRMLHFLFFSLVMHFMISCNTSPESPVNTGHIKISADSLITYNSGMIKMEDQEIEDFIARYKWDMTTTATGLRYMIYTRGSGRKVTIGCRVTIHYSVGLITGDPVYSSSNEGPKEFKAGHGMVESGLDEGILLMREGDHAKFIVPSHLAFGLLGDQKKIPARATLVYDVELVKIK